MDRDGLHWYVDHTISDFPTLGKSAKQMIYMVAAFLEKLGCVTPVHVGNRVQSVFH